MEASPFLYVSVRGVVVGASTRLNPPDKGHQNFIPI